MDLGDWNHCHAELEGVRIHYVRHGAGLPLILQHGWPEFWYVWHKNIHVLAERFDVIVPDLRGFGDSDKPGGRLEADHMVDDMAALADHLGLERFGIVTHDVGAWLAQRLAVRDPGRLAGLFFFNCPYPGIGGRWIAPDHIKEIWYQSFHQEDWAAELIGHDRATCRLYFGRWLAYWAHDAHAFDDDLEAWVDNFMKPGNLQGGFNWYSAINHLRQRIASGEAPPQPVIDVPTHVLWGASDPVLKAQWIDGMEDYFSDLDATVAEGVGHFVHYEAPDLANREIAAFFGKL
jgi:pimeloyl-ACP methyl ester carboxylesterase